MMSGEARKLRAEGSMMSGEARKLRAHKGAVLCCAASPSSPHLVASSSEDGSVCWFDLRCEEIMSSIVIGKFSVPSICFNQGKEHVLYAASGNSVIQLDMRKTGSECQNYAVNKDEINQISLSHNCCYLAAGDDSGEVKIIDVQQHCLYKTLRSGHRNICSSAQFNCFKPWEVISGGLDSKIILWDYSRGRYHTIIDPVEISSSNTVQMCNPPFVHSMEILENNATGRNAKILAVARGDGGVEVLDLDLQTCGEVRKCGHLLGANNKSKCKEPLLKNAKGSKNPTFSRIQLNADFGGHTASVSCVTFSRFGTNGKLILSGSNDRSVKIWNWTTLFGDSSSNDDPLSLTINHNRKVNWLCSTSQDKENLIVCDTSNVVKAYTIN